MGWFNIDKSDDIIGDGPLDTIMSALAGINAAYGRGNAGKLTPYEAVSSLQYAIKKQPGNYFLFPDEALELDIRLVLSPGSVSVQAQDDNPNNEKIFPFWHEAFENIAVEYEESEMSRKPTINELLKTFKMVISYKPQNYFWDMEEKNIEDMTFRT